MNNNDLSFFQNAVPMQMQAPGMIPLQSPMPMSSAQSIWGNEPEKYCAMLQRLTEKGEEAFLEVEKKKRIKEDDLDIKIKTAELRADIASQRELQKTEVSISREGQIEICKQQFGADRKERFPFQLSEVVLLHGYGVKNEAVLKTVFEIGGKKVELYWNMKELGERTINKKFNEGGICFGFSQRKETEIRRLVLSKLLSVAREIELPPFHGWYRDKEGKLHFAFPEDMVWQEVRNYV